MDNLRSSDEVLPALFVPHGAPTFALRPGAAGAALSDFANALPQPRAVIIASAHWDTEVPTVGFAERLETIHDFAGFPKALYDIRYPVTGCRELAECVARSIEHAGMPVRRDLTRGLDHGAWIPLRMMFPQADVPVIPVSIQSVGGPDFAYRLGQALAPLTHQGCLVVGSGSVTHNLRDYMIAARSTGLIPPYVRHFADWLADRLSRHQTSDLLHYRDRAPDAVRAHPTEEHLLPLYIALGAGGPDATVQRFHAGIDDYVIAMDGYAFQSH